MMMEIVERIKNDPEYIENIDYGKPRKGHPEGKVSTHILQLESNLNLISHFLNPEQYWTLMFLIHTHDTFKAKAVKGSAIMDPNSHASLARKFAAKYVYNEGLLDMIQYHDEGFALYRQIESKGKCNQERLDDLFYIIDDWNLFLFFNIIDNCTPGKDNASVYWLLEEAINRMGSKISPDLLSAIKIIEEKNEPFS